MEISVEEIDLSKIFLNLRIRLEVLKNFQKVGLGLPLIDIHVIKSVRYGVQLKNGIKI